MITISIQDLYTDINVDDDIRIPGFHEVTLIIDNDIQIINNEEALWQGFKGEVLTPLGVIDGVGMENYGCRLLETRGMPLTDLIIQLQNTYIRALIQKYPQINDIPKIRTFVDRHRVLKVCFLDTIYGQFERELYLHKHELNPNKMWESSKV